MITASILFVVGLVLSAFFSGSETGLYRATRVRLAIEALTGNWLARTTLWLISHPTLFVATALVGNNLANYLVTLSVVIGIQHLVSEAGALAEMAGSILVAPVVFILGELFPKSIFYDAPNRLIKRCTLPFAFCVVLFAPVSLMLAAFSFVVKLFTKDSPQELTRRLARRELAELLTEGHEAGILKPAQQSLAQALLVVASLPLRTFASRQGRVVRATTTMSKSDVLRLAQRYKRSLLPVEDPRNKRKLVGYLHTMELYLDNSPALPDPKPMIELNEHKSCLAALRILNRAGDSLGHVIDDHGKTLGFITAEELRSALLKAQ